jgi:hypothetical protein
MQPQTVMIQGDQKVSVHLTITVQSSGAQRLFDNSVSSDMAWFVFCEKLQAMEPVKDS